MLVERELRCHARIVAPDPGVDDVGSRTGSRWSSTHAIPVDLATDRVVRVDGIETRSRGAYRDHSWAVYSLARGLCAAEVADDITHQVFLDLWHHPERDDRAGASLREPLLAMAHALSLGAIWSEAIRSAPEPLTDVGRGAGLRDAGHLRGRDDEREPAECPLDLLPREEREAIVAVHHRGYTCAEASVALGVDEATVKAQIRQGLRRLGSALARPASPVAHGGDADLAVALDRRDVVAHAQGIVMEREGRTASEAEGELVRSAEHLGMSLHAYAEVVVADARVTAGHPPS